MAAVCFYVIIYIIQWQIAQFGCVDNIALGYSPTDSHKRLGKKYAENNAICSYWKKLQKGTQNIQYHNKTTVFHQLSGGSRYGMEGILPISIFQKNNAIRSCLFAWRSD